MRTAAVLTTAILLSGCAPASAQTAPPFARINAAFAQIAQASGAPGAQFALLRDGRIVDTYDYGMADTAAGTPVTDDTVFAIASCSKPLTAMAIMKLIEGGTARLTLDTRAFEYLNLGRAADPRLAQITVRDLLNHASGLPHDVPMTGNDPIDGARAALRTQLKFDPGTQQAYSNEGFVVLGAVVEKASGMPYARYIRQNVLLPAGVSDGGPAADRPANQAVRYGKNGAAVPGAPKPNAGAALPAGGWILSASDLARVLGAYDAGRIVSQDSRKSMLAPPFPPLQPRPNGAAFGLGWDVVIAKDGGIFFGKNGGLAGASAWMEHRPDGLDLAVLYNGTNARGAHPGGLKALEAALDQYMGEAG